MSATFKVTLQDNVSRNANRAARSVKRLGDDMRSVRSSARGSSSSLGSLTSSFGAVKAAAAAAAAAVGVIAVKLGMNIASGAAFMEQNRLAFGLMLKGADAGGKALEEVRAIALDLALPIKDTVKNYRKLLAMQFKPQAAQDIIKLGADMSALGATTEEVSSIIRAMTQIKAKGRLQQEELTGQLAEAGVSAELVYKQLGKQLGKTTDEVRKMITAGKVDADTALDAIKKAILQKLGTEAPGQAAKEFTSTLQGMWNQVQTQAENTLLNISERVGPKLKESLQGIMEFEAPPGMGKMLDSLIERFDIIQVVIEQVKAAASGFLEGFSEGFEDIKPALDAAVKAMLEFAGEEESLNAIQAAFVMVGKGAAIALGVVILLAGAATAAFAGLNRGIDEAIEFLKSTKDRLVEAFDILGDIELGESASGLGSQIVDGIVDGITSGASAVVEAITTLANDAIQAAKDALDISSPSKVFAEIGRNIDRGLAGGVQAEQGLVAASTAQTVSAATQSAAQVVNNINARVSPGSQTFNITGAESPEATAGAIAQLQLGDMADAFEQLGNTMGGAVG